MGCFSLCWLPYFIVACAQIFEIHHTTSLLYKAAFSLAMTNSALNPIIYSWKNSNFRRAFAQLLHCKSPNCHLMSALDAPIKSSSICENIYSVSSAVLTRTNTESCGKVRSAEQQSSDVQLQRIYTISSLMSTTEFLSVY